MSNPLSVRRVRVQTIDAAGIGRGRPSYGIVASDSHTTLFTDTFETLAALNAAIAAAPSILAVVDDDGVFSEADHGKIGRDNYYGKDWYKVASPNGVPTSCRLCGCAIELGLDDVAFMLRVRGMATGTPDDPKAASPDDQTLCVDCEDE
jgi:hypothetical protein